MPTRLAFRGLHFVDGGPAHRRGEARRGAAGAGARKRVNEVYVNNEGEEMNTSGAAQPPLMAGATPVGGTTRK